MKKRNRFLAILLTLAMVFSMLPAGALAADPAPRPQVEETAPTETPAIPTETTAIPTETPAAPVETPAAPVSLQSAAARDAKTPIDAAVSSNATWDGATHEVVNAVTVSGTTTITVTGDVTVKAPITVSGGTVTFEGGGKLIRDAGFKGKMLDVTGGTVTLTNITLDGAAVASVTNPLVSVAASAALTLNTGATLQNNKTTGNYTTSLGGAIATAGTVNMSTGAVIKDSSAYYGGGVFVDGTGIFNMTGGTISGCIATAGGSGAAICIQPKSNTTGAVNISGGEITGNTAAVYGGAIHGGQNAGTIAITGTANIHGNVSASGYAIYPLSSTVTVGGAAKITGNTNGAGAPSNLYAASSKTFAIDPDLSAGANIGVTGVAEGIITTTTAIEGDAAFVHSDDTQKKIVYSAGKLSLEANPNVYVSAVGSDTNGDGSFAKPYATIGTAYTALTNGGEIRVLSDLTAAAATTFDTVSKNVTLTSCKADGTAWAVPGDTRTVKRGAGFTSDSVLKVSNGTVTLDHITLDGNAQWDHADQLTTRQATNTTAYQLIQITGGELVLDGGATVQNHARVTTVDSVGDKGGAIYLTGSTAKLTMNTGAKLLNNYSGGTSTAGDGGAVSIWDGALFTMNNGTISGNTANRMGGAVRVSSTDSNKGQFILNGGSITGNALIKPGADQGGGVSVSGGTLAIASVKNATPIVIKDNTLKDGTLSNVRAVVNGLALGDMSGKISDIGITADANTVFATSALNTDLPYFHSDDLTYGVVLDGTTLKLVALLADVYVADGTANNNSNSVPAGADTNAGTAAAPFLTLGHAYDWVAPGGTIHVMEDMTVDATIAFDMDKTITLESCKTDGSAWADGNTHTIKRNTGFVATMLDITAGNVTMKHLVLDGVGKLMDGVGGHVVDTKIDATAPLVQVYSSTKAPTLTLDTGAVLQNNYNTAGACAGIKVGSSAAKYGNLNIQTGAKIQYNQTGGTAEESSSGCAVYVRGSHTQFTMTGGEISHNSGEAYATVNFCMNKDGTAVISGGSITANTCTKGEGTGGVLVDSAGILTITSGSITNNTGAYGGIALWDGSGVLNMGGGAAINITGNKTSGDVVRNVYLNGTKINITSHLTAGSTIGVYSTAIPTPGHPVLVATGADATDATYFTSDKLDGAGIRAAKPGDTDSTGIYLDVAEKAVAQIIKADTSKVLYKTFDAAIAAIKTDSGNLLHNGSEGTYTVELLADCTTNEAFPAKTITMQSISGQKYTLMVKNFITTAGGTFTAKDIKFADATPQHEWLQAYSPWTFTGCELPNFAVVGVTVTLNAGTVVNGNIRVDNRATSQLSMKAGAVEVTGEIQFNHADGKVTLLAGSDATKHYNVRYASNIDLGSNKIVMDGTVNSALADVAASGNVAKNVSIFGGNDATKEWVAIGSDKNVITKVAKSYWVSAVAHGAESAAGDDALGNGTYLKPYKTIAKAYAAGVSAHEAGLDIRVLSDLPTTAATTFANDAITSVKISSYKGENTVADKPWTITRSSATDALLAITKGSVNLTNITLDGKGNTLASDTALVTVAAGTALTLDDKATIQNNKNSTASGLGGGVNVTGTLTMNPGSTITGNSLTGGGSTYGGGVYVEDTATFQMNGGTISNNTVTSPGGSGGGIMVDPDGTTATVRIGGDAQITGNSCGANGAAIHGGAAGSTITISGNAKMTGNKITAAAGYVGAAVYPNGGSLVLSDGVQITGNSNQNGKACNVYLGTGKTITIGGAHMGASSAVGVYCQTMPSTAGATVDIATNAVEADKPHFVSDRVSEAGIKFDGDKVVLAYDARYIPEPVYPGGPEPTRPDPNVTVEPGPGKVTTRPKNPDPGTKVTVTIEPETGWEIDKVVIVTVPGGEPVVVTGTNPITYIAPDPNTVKITVKYKRIPVDPKTSEVSKLLNSDDHIAYMVGGVDGKFDPTRGITRGETAQLFYNLLRNKNAAAAPGFTDVDSAAWYAPAVNALAELKVIEGRGGKYFDPMAHISRAEFTAIAMRFAKSAKGEVTFTDVPGDYWAESAISGAAQYGWIMGYEDGSFKPMEDITRAEAAKIVNTMLGRFPDEKFIDGATDLKTFPDVEKSNWAFYQIAEATNAHNFTKVKNAETWKK